MKTLFNPENRNEILSRIEKVTAGVPGRWGKMNSEQMLVHLTQSMRMATGELVCTPRKLPIRYFPLKQLIIYLLPFPKGAPTAPELLPPAESGPVEDRKRELTQAIHDVAKRESATSWPDHPAFGKLTQQGWGVLGYRHIDHHLRQFGV